MTRTPSASRPTPPRRSRRCSRRAARRSACAALRRLIEISTSIVGEAFEAQIPASQLLDEAESRIFQISQAQGGKGFTRIKELLWPAMERIEALQRGGQSVTGVASGFYDLDEMPSGFQPSDLVIVAARPSMAEPLDPRSKM